MRDSERELVSGAAQDKGQQTLGSSLREQLTKSSDTLGQEAGRTTLLAVKALQGLNVWNHNGQIAR